MSLRSAFPISGPATSNPASRSAPSRPRAAARRRRTDALRLRRRDGPRAPGRRAVGRGRSTLGPRFALAARRLVAVACGGRVRRITHHGHSGSFDQPEPQNHPRRVDRRRRRPRRRPAAPGSVRRGLLLRADTRELRLVREVAGAPPENRGRDVWRPASAADARWLVATLDEARAHDERAD